MLNEHKIIILLLSYTLNMSQRPDFYEIYTRFSCATTTNRNPCFNTTVKPKPIVKMILHNVFPC